MTTNETQAPQPAPPYDGGPAFPLVAEGHEHVLSVGLTLRDYFAAHASEEDIADFRIYGGNSREEARYEYADAMLKARKGAA